MMSEPTWFEIEQVASVVQLGVVTSAVTMRFGCGHEFSRFSADWIWHTCPRCYYDRVVADSEGSAASGVVL